MRATDWSVGGLRLNGYPATLPQPGDFLPLNLSLPFQGFNVGFEAVGEVVRVVPERREIGIKFVDLGDREARLMQHFVEELVRGSMTDIEDTIQRMDVPLTPVSTKPDVNPKKELPSSRRSLRMMLYSGFYIAAGVLIFGYTGLTMYTNFFRLEIDAAVVSAPVETVRADADGRVHWTGFKPGDQVAAGEIVLEVSDNTVEHQLDLAEIDVKEKQSQLLFLKRRQVEELSRMEDFATLEESDLAQKKLDIDARQVAYASAKAHYERVAALGAKGFATRTQIEEALSKRTDAEKDLARMQLDRETRARLFGKNLGIRSLAGDALVGERASIEAEIKLAEAQIEMSREKRDALINHRSRLSVQAPFAGTLLDLPRNDNGTIRRGDVIAVIEQAIDINAIVSVRRLFLIFDLRKIFQCGRFCPHNLTRRTRAKSITHTNICLNIRLCL